MSYICPTFFGVIYFLVLLFIFNNSLSVATITISDKTITPSPSDEDNANCQDGYLVSTDGTCVAKDYSTTKSQDIPTGDDDDDDIFRAFEKWTEEVGSGAQKFLQNHVFTQPNKKRNHKGGGLVNTIDPFTEVFHTHDNDQDGTLNFKDTIDTVLGMLDPSSSSSSTDGEETSISSSGDRLGQIMQTARSVFRGQDQLTVQRTMKEVIDVFGNAWENATRMMDHAFGPIFKNEQHRFNPIMMWYYLEREDMVKHPSWKRRWHRYHKRIDSAEVVVELHHGLYLSQLAYVDSVSEVQDGLSGFMNNTFELMFAKTDGFPAEPAHFLALQKQPKRRRKGGGMFSLNRRVEHGDEYELEVLWVVRGTKELGDLLSDALLEMCDFMTNGKAHSGIAKAGQYLVDTHIETLKHLHNVSSSTTKMKVRLIGHSLGAGSAAIAAIILNENYGDWLEATSLGFGCPALLDANWSSKVAPYITTVVSDADIVPRMSGATIANLFLDMMAYDWTSKGLEDISQFLDFLQSQIKPLEVPKDRIMKWVNDTMDRDDRPYFDKVTKDRLAVELFPPGDCIHLFRDGIGYTGTYSPCETFRAVEFARTLVDDHLIPPGYHRAFLTWMRETKQDWNYNFPHDLMAIPV